MNERIQKLAEQAVNSIPDRVDFDIPDVFKEKFAELIVSKCLSIMDRHYDASIASDEIKEHFGVEE